MLSDFFDFFVKHPPTEGAWHSIYWLYFDRSKSAREQKLAQLLRTYSRVMRMLDAMAKCNMHWWTSKIPSKWGQFQNLHFKFSNKKFWVWKYVFLKSEYGDTGLPRYLWRKSKMVYFELTQTFYTDELKRGIYFKSITEPLGVILIKVEFRFLLCVSVNSLLCNYEIHFELLIDHKTSRPSTV